MERKRRKTKETLFLHSKVLELKNEHKPVRILQKILTSCLLFVNERFLYFRVKKNSFNIIKESN
jgi:hypothetical protein